MRHAMVFSSFFFWAFLLCSSRLAFLHDSLKPEIQALYDAHRTTRNAQQRDKFLSAEFRELIIDPFLLRLEDPSIEPGFRDPRNCLVIWARPPGHVLRLASHLQALLKKAAPGKNMPSQPQDWEASIGGLLTSLPLSSSLLQACGSCLHTACI